MNEARNTGAQPMHGEVCERGRGQTLTRIALAGSEMGLFQMWQIGCKRSGSGER